MNIGTISYKNRCILNQYHSFTFKIDTNNIDNELLYKKSNFNGFLVILNFEAKPSFLKDQNNFKFVS